MFSLVGELALEYISPDDICSMESAPVLNDVAGQHINIFLTTTVQPQLFTRGGCNIFKFFIHFAKKKKKKSLQLRFVLSFLRLFFYLLEALIFLFVFDLVPCTCPGSFVASFWLCLLV